MPSVPLTPVMRHIVTNEPEDLDEALVNAEVLIDESKDVQGLTTIRQYAVDIRDDTDKEKAAKEILDGLEIEWDEYQRVEQLTIDLTAAKEALKRRRGTSVRHVDQAEILAAAKRQKKEDQEILSDYLVAHFKITGERQVLMNESTGDAREVRISAKLGKETKYQTSLDLGSKR